MESFNIINYKGEQTYVRQVPGYINAAVLGGGVGEIFAIPSSGRIVVFSADGKFYAKSW